MPVSLLKCLSGWVLPCRAAAHHLRDVVVRKTGLGKNGFGLFAQMRRRQPVFTGTAGKRVGRLEVDDRAFVSTINRNDDAIAHRHTVRIGPSRISREDPRMNKRGGGSCDRHQKDLC